MIENNNLYPLGSIVYLQEGTQKLMIIGRGVVYTDSDTNEDVYVDYVGCEYPIGINPENTIFFNHENIDKVIFEGYIDEDEERFQDILGQWQNNVEVPKKEI